MKKNLFASYAFGFTALLSLNSPAAHADDVNIEYMTAEAFVQQSLTEAKPSWKMLSLSAELKKQAKQILGHEYAGSRVRYWQSGNKYVWVLEEIGKDKPITMGICVNQDRIENVQILVYREARGGEVAQESFLQQFKSAQLEQENKLNKSIDSISGATLSVNAVTKASQLALLFSRQAAQPH